MAMRARMVSICLERSGLTMDIRETRGADVSEYEYEEI